MHASVRVAAVHRIIIILTWRFKAVSQSDQNLQLFSALSFKSFILRLLACNFTVLVHSCCYQRHLAASWWTQRSERRQLFPQRVCREQKPSLKRVNSGCLPGGPKTQLQMNDNVALYCNCWNVNEKVKTLGNIVCTSEGRVEISPFHNKHCLSFRYFISGANSNMAGSF